MTLLDRARRALFLAASLCLLAACSGGGSDDDDEPEPPEEEDSTGVWIGTYGGTPNRMTVIAAPDGSFAGLIAPTTPPGNNGRIIVGTGDVTAPNIVNATGDAYAVGAAFPNGSFAAPLTISAGRVTERVSLSGNFLAGGETTTFSLSFASASTRAPSLATLAGVYAGPGGAATVTIRTDGTATFNHSNGCVGNGNFTIVDPAWNIYRWSLSVANCTTPPVPNHTASGLATLIDNPAGGTANVLVMAGTATGAPLPWWAFNGTK
jgi:hypothetical protein